MAEEVERVWYRVEEAALRLGATERWMRRQIAERTVTYNKLGGIIRFHVDVLDELIANGQVPAERELPVVGGRPGKKRRKKAPA